MNEARPEDENDDRTVALPPSKRGSTPSLIAERYELRDAIGSGAGGEVFEAYDRVLGRLVAVKVMPIEDDASDESRERLRRFQFEARAVSRHSHPNIMKIYDFGQDDDIAWIVMELVIGETLKDAMRRIGRASLEDAARIAASLLAALHYAHERGIVHRDVKPGNILLEMNLAEELGDVRLSDFGIARMDSEEKTVLGQMIGTPWVMAPEQLRGEEVDRRIDIWAVGVILYEMLTGERPFKGTMPGIFHRIQTEEPLRPTALRPDLPRGIDDVIATALAKRPEHRFATALDMAEAIRAALPAAPAVPPTPLPSADDPPPPSKAPLSVPSQRRSGFPRGLLFGIALGSALTTLILRNMTPQIGMHGHDADMAASLPTPLGGTAMATEMGEAILEAPVPSERAAPIAPSMEARIEDAPAAIQGFGDASRVNDPVLPPIDPVSLAAGADVPVTAAIHSESPQSEAPSPVGPVTTRSAPVARASHSASRAPRATPEPMPASTPDRDVPARAPDQCNGEQILMRSGNHAGFGRLVFEWRTPVAFDVHPTDLGAEIRFHAAPCRPVLEGIQLPRNVTRLFADDARNVLVLETTRSSTVTHHRWRGRLVLDVADSPR